MPTSDDATAIVINPKPITLVISATDEPVTAKELLKPTPVLGGSAGSYLRYYVTNDGRVVASTVQKEIGPLTHRVYSTNKHANHCGYASRAFTRYFLSNRVLKPGPNNKNAPQVHVGHRMLLVGRLVATAWVPNPRGVNETDHLDNDRSNNHPSNLEWVTHAQNMQRMQDHYRALRPPKVVKPRKPKPVVVVKRKAGRPRVRSLEPLVTVRRPIGRPRKNPDEVRPVKVVRAKHTNKIGMVRGSKYYNNGIQNLVIAPGQPIPGGFVLGMGRGLGKPPKGKVLAAYKEFTPEGL